MYIKKFENTLKDYKLKIIKLVEVGYDYCFCVFRDNRIEVNFKSNSSIYFKKPFRKDYDNCLFSATLSMEVKNYIKSIKE